MLVYVRILPRSFWSHRMLGMLESNSELRDLPNGSKLRLLNMWGWIFLDWINLLSLLNSKLPYSQLHFISMPMHPMYVRLCIRRKWKLRCVFFHNAQLPGVHFSLSLHKVWLFPTILLKQYFQMWDMQHTWLHDMRQSHHLLNLWHC